MEKQAAVENLLLMTIDSKYKIISIFHLEIFIFWVTIYSFEIHFSYHIHFPFLSIQTAETLVIALEVGGGEWTWQRGKPGKQIPEKCFLAFVPQA